MKIKVHNSEVPLMVKQKSLAYKQGCLRKMRHSENTQCQSMNRLITDINTVDISFKKRKKKKQQFKNNCRPEVQDNCTLLIAELSLCFFRLRALWGCFANNDYFHYRLMCRLFS